MQRSGSCTQTGGCPQSVQMSVFFLAGNKAGRDKFNKMGGMNRRRFKS